MSRTGLNKAECCRDRAEWSSESRLRAVEPIVVRDRAESIHSSAMSVNVNVHKTQLRHFVTFIIFKILLQQLDKIFIKQNEMHSNLRKFMQNLNSTQ